MMDDQLVDLGLVYELSDNDPQYIHNIISLFLNTVADKLAQLESLINEGKDYRLIFEIAHALKSSASVVKIKDLYNDLAGIDSLARNNTGIAEIRVYFQNILSNYHKALPVLYAELERNKLSH